MVELLLPLGGIQHYLFQKMVKHQHLQQEGEEERRQLVLLQLQTTLELQYFLEVDKGVVGVRVPILVELIIKYIITVSKLINLPQALEVLEEKMVLSISLHKRKHLG